MFTSVFGPESRLMLVAPHPDDEALACSIILQRAVCARATIRVLYATDGDNNPWPQRVLERKWRLGAADRKRWGKLRRAEAVLALHALGVHRSDARFLGLADQELTDLLMTDCQSTLGRFATSINGWSPTDLLIPSIHDTHPDHNALAVMLRLVLANSYPEEPPMSVWTYAVHGKSQAFFDRAEELQPSTTETKIKEQAIRCHQTQLKLSRRRFLAYAARPERFLRLGSRESTHSDGPIRRVLRHSHVLGVKLQLSAKPMSTTTPKLFVLGRDLAGGFRCVRIQVPVRPSAAEILDCHAGDRLGLARYHGNASAGELAIPVDGFSPGDALFIKIERRSWFFDEAGWFETPPIVAETRLVKMPRTQSVGAEVLS